MSKAKCGHFDIVTGAKCPVCGKVVNRDEMGREIEQESAGRDIEGKHRKSGMRGSYPKFQLGQVLSTPGAIDAAKENGVSLGELIFRHHTGDWGELDDHDRQTNEDALRDGSRIFSAYTVDGVKFWVITEADRSVTTILLPEEY